jgi:hypothetical protein
MLKSKENQRCSIENLFNVCIKYSQKNHGRVFQNGTDFLVPGGVYSIF